MVRLHQSAQFKARRHGKEQSDGSTPSAPTLESVSELTSLQILMSSNKRPLRRRLNLKVSYGGLRMLGRLAQRPEHFVYIEGVEGSNPPATTRASRQHGNVRGLS